MIVKVLEKLKNNLYLILPLICIIFWAFIAVYKDNFTLIPAADFPTFYYVAYFIFTKPEQIYFLVNVQEYTYTPFFATILAPMALLTFEQAHWFFFFLILIISLFCIVIFNQILILKNVSNKIHRFLFLIAISNGIIYVQMFDTLTGRIFTAFGLLWFLKREIKIRILNVDKTNIKFIFSQMMILMFAFGITLQYFFLVFLYLFHDVKLKEIFSRNQLNRYLLMIISFLIQNFMLIVILIISPEAIINLSAGYWRGERSLGSSSSNLTYSYLLEKRPRDPVDTITTTIMVLGMYYNLSSIKISILLFSIVIMSLITILIHLRKELSIENKFGLWALFSLFFYTFTQNRYFVGLLPMIALLFLNYEFKFNTNFFKLIKNNYLYLLGLLSIMVLYFLPPIHYIIRIFPIIMNIPISIMLYKYTYGFLILSLILLVLNLKKHKKIDSVS